MAGYSKHLLWVEEGNNDEWGNEVNDGGPEHHVKRAIRLLVEGDCAPGWFFELYIIVLQVVNLN